MSNRRAANRSDHRFSWRGLLPQLLVVVILPLSILLVIVAFGGLAMHQQTMRELAGERDMRTAAAVSATLGALIQQRADAVERLAWRVTARSSVDELKVILQQAGPDRRLFDGGLAFMSPDNGGFVALDDDTAFWEAIPPETVAELEEAYRARTIPEAGWSDWHGLLPVGDGVNMLFILHPTAGDVAAVGAFSPGSVIETAIQPLLLPDSEADVFVVDPEQDVLYYQGDQIEHAELVSHPGVAEAFRNQFGATYMTRDEREHVVAYSPVPLVGWALVIEEPWETVASPMLRATENAPLVLIPVVLLAILALWFAARYIVQPLQALESKAVELGWGDFQAIEESVGGIVEIRNLQAELVHLAHKVRSAQQGLRDYIGAITFGQEDERRRLARELHDDTLQSLIALNQRLQLLQLALSEDPGASEQAHALGQVQELAEQTIQDLRRATRALRPVYLEELGLSAALEMLARETGQAQGLAVEFQRIGSEQRQAPEVELALYRMAQEALNNIVRHAEAGRAVLRIAYTPELITLEVSDDGMGFDVPDSPAVFTTSGHFGLLGLYERAEMIGAQLEIHSSSGEGTRMTVILPVVEQAEKL